MKKTITVALAALCLLAGCGEKEEKRESKWNNKGDITIVVQEGEEALYETLSDSVGLSGALTKELHPVETEAEVKEMVAGNEYAIGCLLEEEADETVKVVLKDEKTGLAVVVSPKNGHEALTKEQVRDIFGGELSKWNEVLWTSQDGEGQ